jgi:hypothetical protein
LAEGKTDDQGAFKLNGKEASKDSGLYVVAKGGTAKAADSEGATDAIALLAVLGTTPPKSVAVNATAHGSITGLLTRSETFSPAKNATHDRYLHP